MKIKWKIEICGKSSGQENMEKDISMLSDLKSPKVRIYGWSNNCVSLGYSQSSDKEIDLEKAKIHNIEIVKRPTGGGIVFHNTDEVTYCVAAPAEYFPKGIKASYFFISEIILKAIKKMGIDAEIKSQIRNKGYGERNTGYGGWNSNPLPLTPYPLPQLAKQRQLCFSFVQDYEITYNNRKLVGSAQKRSRKFVLQQGTIAVSRPDNIFFEVLKNQRDIESHNDSLITVNEILNKTISFSKIANALTEEFTVYV